MSVSYSHDLIYRPETVAKLCPNLLFLYTSSTLRTFDIEISPLRTKALALSVVYVCLCQAVYSNLPDRTAPCTRCSHANDRLTTGKWAASDRLVQALIRLWPLRSRLCSSSGPIHGPACGQRMILQLVPRPSCMTLDASVSRPVAWWCGAVRRACVLSCSPPVVQPGGWRCSLADSFLARSRTAHTGRLSSLASGDGGGGGGAALPLHCSPSVRRSSAATFSY